MQKSTETKKGRIKARKKEEYHRQAKTIESHTSPLRVHTAILCHILRTCLQWLIEMRPYICIGHIREGSPPIHVQHLSRHSLIRKHILALLPLPRLRLLILRHTLRTLRISRQHDIAEIVCLSIQHHTAKSKRPKYYSEGKKIIVLSEPHSV